MFALPLGRATARSAFLSHFPTLSIRRSADSFCNSQITTQQPPTSILCHSLSLLQKLQIESRRFPCLSLYRQLECAKSHLESTSVMPIFPFGMFPKIVSARLANFILPIIPGRHVSPVITSQMPLISFFKKFFSKDL